MSFLLHPAFNFIIVMIWNSSLYFVNSEHIDCVKTYKKTAYLQVEIMSGKRSASTSQGTPTKDEPPAKKPFVAIPPVNIGPVATEVSHYGKGLTV